MQAFLKKIIQSTEHSFLVRTDNFNHFYAKWHFHPEVELTHIAKGSGVRFIGDSIEEFNDGDLVLVGSNLPHVWRNADTYFMEDSGLRAEAKVVQFLPQCFGKDFFELLETKPIQKLLNRSARGLKITGATKGKVVEKLQQLLETTGIYRITLFLHILDDIAHSDEVVPLSSDGFLKSYHVQNGKIIDKIFEFTITNYYRKILIDEVAEAANMSVSNFCRYFKAHTQKTYIQFLNEVRIGFACRMLIENDKSIQQIASDCGFNNLSNFNRQFISLKNQTPKEYRTFVTKL